MSLNSKSKDFIYDYTQHKPFRRREMVVRIVAILLISLYSPILFIPSPFLSSLFVKVYLVSILRTAILWHGSMLIINFWTSRYSIFKEPVKLLLFQTLMLAVFVVLVEKGELLILGWVTNSQLPKTDTNELMISAILITFLISAIYASVGFFMQWKKNLLRAQTLEKANIEAQYEALKTQVNPHFLFNSLNTLLSLVQGNNKAELYIENLSEFMRYILKNRDRNAVSIMEELEVARQYIYLQKSRFDQKLVVNINVQEKYHSAYLPPLTLQMLIENAIKHNEVSSEKSLTIDIYNDEKQNLIVENILQKKIDSEPSTGIGLKNIENRFQFLSGKNITVIQENGKFRVILPIIWQIA
jgi:two-component system, LytTR family, sensor kinase